MFLTAAEKVMIAFEENQRAIRLMEEEKVEIAKKKARNSEKLVNLPGICAEIRSLFRKASFLMK